MARVTIHTREMNREIQNPEVEVSAETKRHQEEICALHAMYAEKLARKDIEHQKKMDTLTDEYSKKSSAYNVACVKIIYKTIEVEELKQDKESLFLELKAARENFKENSSSEVRVDFYKAMEPEDHIELLEKSCETLKNMLVYKCFQHEAVKQRNKRLEQLHRKWHEFSRVGKLRRGHTQLKEANDEAFECPMQCEDLQQKSPTNGYQIQKTGTGAERLKTRKLRKHKRRKEKSPFVV